MGPMKVLLMVKYESLIGFSHAYRITRAEQHRICIGLNYWNYTRDPMLFLKFDHNVY